VPKPLVIVDAGSNIGITAVYFADYADKVYALEPCKDHYDCIRNTLELNEQWQDVFPMKVALWDKDGTYNLHHSSNPTAHSLLDNGIGGPIEEVTTVTLSTLMRMKEIDTIDLLKLDVEGAESEILRGESFKSVAHRIRYIIGEWHSWTMLSQEALRRELVSAGYEAAWLGLGNGAPTIFVAWRQGEIAPVYGGQAQ